MSHPSNLYAEKIYSEHPLVLWALDEQSDYASLISEVDRDILSYWAITGGLSYSGSGITGEPFPSSISTLIEGTVPVGPTSDIVFVSPNITTFQELNSTLGTFCVGSYFYSNSAFLQSVSIGYEYTDTTTSQIIQTFKDFSIATFQGWGFVSGTFEIPLENTDLRIIMKISVGTGGALPADYQFYINGLSLGQWSEEFNATSLGVTTETFPTNIALSTTSQVVPAAAYGISQDTAYYLTNDSALVAKNASVPLVFGSSNISKLTPNVNGDPSLIFPGKGFLNESGRYRDYTLEFWLRITSDASTPKRFFGPISSTDGLYVEAGFLTLVIGKKFSSYFVGEWYRPMLVHVRVINDSVTVLINGEQVISLSIETSTTVLPSILDAFGDSQDWLGFYAYEDVSVIEVDCIAIYSYQVPITMAKRRWVYGQGVLSPEGINSSYGGTSTFVDYSFAKYTANYAYPDFAKWQQGSFDNLSVTAAGLTAPEYALPEIFLDTKTVEEFYTDNQDIQTVSSGPTEPNKFFTFRPNVGWADLHCYLNFPKFNILSTEVHALYGVFQIDDSDASMQTLFKMYDPISGDYFSIRKDAANIDYYFSHNGVEEEFYSISSFPIGSPFAVGIDFSSASASFGGHLSAFLGSTSNLQLYIGGDELPEHTFKGKTFAVGIASADNFTNISDYFSAPGFCLYTADQELIDHTASYTLLPIEAYSTFSLDVGISGYWEDYMPLSYFAKYVSDSAGEPFYDLDFLQFNIGYPSPSALLEKEGGPDSWTYGDLLVEYSYPVQRTYSQLDNNLFTGWDNYLDMVQRSVKYYEYDTDQASIRSYISFQTILSGANAKQNSFATSVPAKQGAIIDLADFPSWETSNFEVVDNTLIYPSRDIDFNDYAVVYHLDFNVRGILTKSMSLRRLEFSSQALNQNSFNPIGTRFGTDMFPYTRSGIYYDYKAKNPFSIYKGSTPYLYMTRKSGIEIRGEYDPLVSRGIAVPINKEQADDYQVSAIQVWMRYDRDTFPLTPVELFEVEYKDDSIVFYIMADNPTGTRARVYALSRLTGQEYSGLSYYWNGSIVREPAITVKEWGVLGISFSHSLDLSGYLGGINLTGPMVFNNISYYKATNLQQTQSTLARPWVSVISDGFTNYDWMYWSDNFVWDGVLVLSSSDIYGVDPEKIYETYLGTNKIIIDDEEGMIFDADKIKIHTQTTWMTLVATPV
jgi:hypothetical protein